MTERDDLNTNLFEYPEEIKKTKRPSMNPNGRPPKKGQKSTNPVMIYFTDDELKKLKEYSDRRSGMSKAIKALLYENNII